MDASYCWIWKSYTEFEIKTMNVTADEKQVQVEVRLRTDKYPGKEVVQVYYSAPDGTAGETNTGTCRICD